MKGIVRTVLGAIFFVTGIITEVLWSDILIAIMGRGKVVRSTLMGDDDVEIVKYLIVSCGGVLIIVGLLLLIFGIIALARSEKYHSTKPSASIPQDNNNAEQIIGGKSSLTIPETQSALNLPKAETEATSSLRTAAKIAIVGLSVVFIYRFFFNCLQFTHLVMYLGIPPYILRVIGIIMFYGSMIFFFSVSLRKGDTTSSLRTAALFVIIGIFLEYIEIGFWVYRNFTPLNEGYNGNDIIVFILYAISFIIFYGSLLIFFVGLRSKMNLRFTTLSVISALPLFLILNICALIRSLDHIDFYSIFSHVIFNPNNIIYIIQPGSLFPFFFIYFKGLKK